MTEYPLPLPERNPQTHARHRKEVWWQIILPLLLGMLVICGLSAGAIAAGIGAVGEVSRWADISAIWLIIPPIALALILLVLVGGLAYGVTKLLQVLPPYARLAQDYLVLVSVRARQISNKAVEPVLKARSFWAGFAALRRKPPR